MSQWKLDRNVPGYPLIIDVDTNETICQVAERNAGLVAFPDLLEALEECLNQLANWEGRYHSPCDGCPDCKVELQILPKARAAIAKARP